MGRNANPDSHVQINLGEGLRCAGEDYVEVNHYASIKTYLAVTPTSTLDQQAIDNERLFRHRFGFSAPPLVRARVIELKNQYGLTDDEFRGLRHAGQISFKRDDVSFEPDRFLPMLGWFYILICNALFLSFFVAITFVSTSSGPQILAATLVLATWGFFVWCISKIHLHPWRLLRQVGIIGAGSPQKTEEVSWLSRLRTGRS